MLAHYVDTIVAWDEPKVRAARREREWAAKVADETPWRGDHPRRRSLRPRVPATSGDLGADLALARKLIEK